MFVVFRREGCEVALSTGYVGERGIAEEERVVRYAFRIGVLEDGEVCAAGATVGVRATDPGDGADGYLGEVVLLKALLARKL